jgi:hypothetical protein
MLNPQIPTFYQVTSASTYSGSTILDTAASSGDFAGGYLFLVTHSLRDMVVGLQNMAGSASTNAVISFTPTNVNSFNRFVVTLHNFTSVPGQSMTVSSFSGFTGNPAASATIVSGVLTVTFTSGTLTSGVRASFTVANVVNPMFIQPYSSCSGAATYAVPNALDSTTQCTITESLRVSISPEKYAAGASGGIWISVTPTNVDNLKLNRLVLKLDNFTSAPGTTMNVCCFSGMIEMWSGTSLQGTFASAVFGSVSRSNVPGLRARWYHQQYNSYLPPQSVFDSYTPYFQSIVPNLDFSTSYEATYEATGGLFLYSGGLKTNFIARFDG